MEHTRQLPVVLVFALGLLLAATSGTAVRSTGTRGGAFDGGGEQNATVSPLANASNNHSYELRCWPRVRLLVDSALAEVAPTFREVLRVLCLLARSAAQERHPGVVNAPRAGRSPGFRFGYLVTIDSYVASEYRHQNISGSHKKFDLEFSDGHPSDSNVFHTSFSYTCQYGVPGHRFVVSERELRPRTVPWTLLARLACRDWWEGRAPPDSGEEEDEDSDEDSDERAMSAFTRRLRSALGISPIHPGNGARRSLRGPLKGPAKGVAKRPATDFIRGYVRQRKRTRPTRRPQRRQRRAVRDHQGPHENIEPPITEATNHIHHYEIRCVPGWESLSADGVELLLTRHLTGVVTYVCAALPTRLRISGAPISLGYITTSNNFNPDDYAVNSTTGYRLDVKYIDGRRRYGQNVFPVHVRCGDPPKLSVRGHTLVKSSLAWALLATARCGLQQPAPAPVTGSSGGDDARRWRLLQRLWPAPQAVRPLASRRLQSRPPKPLARRTEEPQPLVSQFMGKQSLEAQSLVNQSLATPSSATLSKQFLVAQPSVTRTLVTQPTAPSSEIQLSVNQLSASERLDNHAPIPSTESSEQFVLAYPKFPSFQIAPTPLSETEQSLLLGSDETNYLSPTASVVTHSSNFEGESSPNLVTSSLVFSVDSFVDSDSSLGESNGTSSQLEPLPSILVSPTPTLEIIPLPFSKSSPSTPPSLPSSPRAPERRHEERPRWEEGLAMESPATGDGAWNEYFHPELRTAALDNDILHGNTEVESHTEAPDLSHDVGELLPQPERLDSVLDVKEMQLEEDYLDNEGDPNLHSYSLRCAESAVLVVDGAEARITSHMAAALFFLCALLSSAQGARTAEFDFGPIRTVETFRTEDVSLYLGGESSLDVLYEGNALPRSQDVNIFWQTCRAYPPGPEFSLDSGPLLRHSIIWSLFSKVRCGGDRDDSSGGADRYFNDDVIAEETAPSYSNWHNYVIRCIPGNETLLVDGLEMLMTAHMETAITLLCFSTGLHGLNATRNLGRIRSVEFFNPQEYSTAPEGFKRIDVLYKDNVSRADDRVSSMMPECQASPARFLVNEHEVRPGCVLWRLYRSLLCGSTEQDQANDGDDSEWLSSDEYLTPLYVASNVHNYAVRCSRGGERLIVDGARVRTTRHLQAVLRFLCDVMEVSVPKPAPKLFSFGYIATREAFATAEYAVDSAAGLSFDVQYIQPTPRSDRQPTSLRSMCDPEVQFTLDGHRLAPHSVVWSLFRHLRCGEMASPQSLKTI